MDFKQGDKVTWKSQAAGSVKIKTGIFLGLLSHTRMPIDMYQKKSGNYAPELRVLIKAPY